VPCVFAVIARDETANRFVAVGFRHILPE
jgi:hypothetical protein